LYQYIRKKNTENDKHNEEDCEEKSDKKNEEKLPQENEKIETTNNEQAQDEEQHEDLPAPPEGIYDDLNTLKAAIQTFAQQHGYAIVQKRSVTGKSAHFKCDRLVIFSSFSFFHLILIQLIADSFITCYFIYIYVYIF
jgi:hypothetical protein